MAITRQQLYDEVWAQPMTTVGARYQVSSSFLARVCARLNVPCPPRGYWAKRKVGKAPRQPALPDVAGGLELEWSPRGGVFVSRSRPLPVAPATRQRRVPPAAMEIATEHPLLVDVRPHFEKVYPQSAWSVEYPTPYKKLIPDIVVSAEGLGRALEVANGLFLALERRGYPVTLAPSGAYHHRPRLDLRDQQRRPLGEYEREGWRPSRPTVVFFGTVAIGLTLYEISEYVEVERLHDRYVRKDTLPPPKRRDSGRSEWVHKEDLPSGRFGLRAYSPYAGAPWQQDWREKVVGDLPAQTEAIVRALTKAAPLIAELVADASRKAEAARLVREAEHRIWLKAERARKRAEAQTTSRQQLMTAIERWARVCEIERFVMDVERRLEQIPLDQRAALVDRLARARALIGNTDAIRWFREWKTPEELYGDPDPIDEAP